MLLDLDDTLYPEREFARGGFRATAALLAERLTRSSNENNSCRPGPCGLESLTRAPELLMNQPTHEGSGYRTNDLFESLWHSFERGVRGSIFDAVLAELNVPHDDALITELVRAYRSHEPQLSLFEDANRLLELLWPKYGVGLLTDGPADVQRRKVKALGLQSRVEAIVYSDDFGREHWKPSPIPYLELLRKMHVDPSHAVYVGDNPKKDFIGARRLGLQTVRIRRPNTEHGHLEPSPGFEADHEITSLNDLPDWLAANERSNRHAA